MNPSFLTLKDIKFSKIHIEADTKVKTRASDFDFKGSMIGCDIKHGPMKNDENSWWIFMGFANSNDGDDVNKCPYLFEFQALGIISIDEHFEPTNLKEKLAFESGSALIYGAIREMAINLSSRSLPGPLMLPTPMFKDSFEEQIKKESKKTKSK